MCAAFWRALAASVSIHSDTAGRRVCAPQTPAYRTARIAACSFPSTIQRHCARPRAFYPDAYARASGGINSLRLFPRSIRPHPTGQRRRAETNRAAHAKAAEQRGAGSARVQSCRRTGMACRMNPDGIGWKRTAYAGHSKRWTAAAAYARSFPTPWRRHRRHTSWSVPAIFRQAAKCEPEGRASFSGEPG